MKKKILGIMAVILTASMLAASLTGCGTQVKATEQEVTGEETIIVTDDESSEDATVSTKEITETEVIGDDDDNISDNVSYTEYEFFYVRDKLDMTDATPMDMNDLDVEGKTYTLNESVNIYATSKGALKGYTKPNIDVYVNSCNENWYCLYFENEASPNDYILVKAEDFIAATGIEIEEKILTTLDDVRKTFMDSLNEIQYQDDTVANFEMLDFVSAEMEFVEFKVPMYCNESDTRQLYRWISQMQVENQLAMYSKFYIEPMEDEFDDEYLWFKVYYKDLQESEQ